MKRLLWGVGLFSGALAIVMAIFFAWAYRPVPPFEPLTYTALTPDYWPTDAWRISTPEAQGMDSQTLLEMFVYCGNETEEDPEFYIDSLTVFRNGYKVADYYPNPNYPRDEMHVIHSVTKSIVSALVGIAIQRGFIDSVDTRVIDMFPQRTFDQMDDRKKSLTIRDLLTMQTGLHSRDSYLYSHEGLFALQQSNDWLQHALSLPMAANPGERFDYSNISTFLLGAVLAEATGTDVLTFARQTLFEPLGIGNVKWEWTDDGFPIAWARMWMTPDDLAKIGLLYLQQGRWDGRQIIPASWIEESRTAFAFPKNTVDVLNQDMSRDSDASIRNWVAQRFVRPFSDGYGYQWWLDRNGNYAALGTSGQYLIVAPGQNLIFVATSKSRGVSQFKPAALFYDYVLPAIQADSPLPDNPQASKSIAAINTAPAAGLKPSAAPDLPAIALQVSGVTYGMENNPFKTDNIRFLFDPAKPYAELRYTAREDWAPDFKIGLDGIARKTPTNAGTFVAAGEWTSRNSLRIEVEIVGYTSFDEWEFRFEDNRLIVTEHSITGDYTYTGKAVSK